MRPSEQNEKTFSKNVAVFEENYWRPDEEEAVKFLKKGKLLIVSLVKSLSVILRWRRSYE
jgi:predicted ATP-dependent Lon-type protease